MNISGPLSQSSSGIRQRLRGVTVVEAAISMPLVILCCLMIIDLCRYGLAQMLMSYAAYTTADAASKNTIEIDTADCSNHLDDCREYMTTFLRLGDEGLETALLAVGASDSGSMIKLKSFEHFFGAAQAQFRTAHPNFTNGFRLLRDIAIIRPGEKIRRDEDFVEIDHASWPYGTNDGASSGWPRALNTWARILDSNPIQVRLEAEFRFVTPFLPKVTIITTQDGWRKTQAFGVPVAPVAPATVPPATPAYTPTPTPTEDPMRTWTPTATIAPPSPTPTIVAFCRDHCRPGDCNPFLCNPPPPAGCGGCRLSRGD